MSIRTTDGGVARKRGGFSPRTAALSALAGLVSGEGEFFTGQQTTGVPGEDDTRCGVRVDQRVC